MKGSLEIKHLFSFPPLIKEDMKILEYIEFLEIEIYDDSVSPEIFLDVSIDPKSIKCSPKFLRFIEDFKELETINGTIGDIFRYSHEETTDLLFFVIRGKAFLIDHEGYIHLGVSSNESESMFYEALLDEYYEFKVYEKERPRV